MVVRVDSHAALWRVELAAEQGQLCLDSNPPADMLGLVQSFVEGLEPATDTTPTGDTVADTAP